MVVTLFSWFRARLGRAGVRSRYFHALAILLLGAVPAPTAFAELTWSATRIEKKAGITDDIIRISVGIEHIDDLLADLEHALDLSSKSIKQGIHANVFHEEAASV